MFKGSSIRILAGAVVASALVGSAFAEMVYDDENSMSAAPTKVEVKNVINTPNAPAPIAATAATATEATASSAAPASDSNSAVSAPPVIVETQKIQKESDKSREKRSFQESVNNELVIQKLEDKRLKQEEKLTEEINQKFNLDDSAKASEGTPAPILKEEKVAQPITDTPGAGAASASTEMSAAPKGEAAPAKPIAQDEIASYQSSTSLSPAPVSGASSENASEKKSGSSVSVIPMAGIATISNDYYDFKNQYTAGVAIGMNATDNISVTLGYAYSDYQVGPKIPGNYVGYSYNPLTFKNNTFDLNMKLYLTGADAKLRPFVGGGAGYSVGYVNYNQNSLGNYGYQWSSNDYQLNQVLGSLQGGLELKVASNVSIGFTYKLLKPLSTTESDDGFYNGGFYSPYGTFGLGGYSYIDPNKQAVRGTLKDSSAQMFLVSASVTF